MKKYFRSRKWQAVFGSILCTIGGGLSGQVEWGQAIMLIGGQLLAGAGFQAVSDRGKADASAH